MASYFLSGDILLPQNCNYEKWAVIACDQHTSEPEYWKAVEQDVAGIPSTFHTFFPEAYLKTMTFDQFDTYQATMQEYLDKGLFREFPNSYLYVERTLCSGQIRQGIVGVIDLEYYDYDPKPDTKIFATEATVLQRVSPRVKLRQNAPLEFSHTVIFCDDPHHSIVEPIGNLRDHLQKLYSFDLMREGGHIEAYLLQGESVQTLEQALTAYEATNSYLVGDGNHSLVTAKLVYQALKEENPQMDWKHHPARYAMVELENIHSPAMVFEPIYRIAVCEKPDQMVRELQELDVPDGIHVCWICGDKEGIVRLPAKSGELPIEVLQRFLDHWTIAKGGSIDYIHGKSTVRALARCVHTVGFLVPDMTKDILFPYVLSGKVMPKKTFSIGQAAEKRYYLEGRKIR